MGRNPGGGDPCQLPPVMWVLSPEQRGGLQNPSRKEGIWEQVRILLPLTILEGGGSLILGKILEVRIFPKCVVEILQLVAVCGQVEMTDGKGTPFLQRD